MVYYLLIGGNSGDRLSLLGEACVLLELHLGNVLNKSAVYETEPWGFEADTGFLNMAVAVSSDKNPEEALSICQIIETGLGRIRSSDQRYTSRTMDIDIILIDAMVFSSETLTVPHPLMQERRFVLRPLNDIASGIVHPVLRKSVAELLDECTDAGLVSVYRG